MKKQLFAFAIMMAAFGSANAQLTSTASAKAEATIIAPIKLTQTSDLLFGKIVASASQAGTIKIDATDELGISNTGGTVPFSQPGTRSAAKFTVEGEPNATYSIQAPADVTLTHSTDNTATMKATLISAADLTATNGDAKLSSTGTGKVFVGGTLAVAAGQKAGAYASPNFDVTVTYN